MKNKMEELSATYSEYNKKENRITFTQENWIKFIEKIEKAYAEILQFEGKGIVFMGEDIDYWSHLQNYAKENMMDELIKDKVKLEHELEEFGESGWEANGNKLYLKGEIKH